MTDREILTGKTDVVQRPSDAALRDSEERYRTMIDDLPGFVYRCENDHDWTMSFISDGCREITGYAPEDLLHNKKLAFNDIIHPDHRERVWQNVQDCLRRKEPFQQEYPILVASGETDHWVWERGRGIFSNAGQFLYIQGFITDITDRKRAEETLYNERLLLRTLIDNIPDSIYSKDLACRKTLANLADVRYLGAKSEADVLGKSDFGIYPQEVAERFLADDQLVMQTGEPILNREEYIYDEDQQKRWLLSSKLPLRNQEGRIIGLVGIGRDITDRKRAEEALRASEMRYRTFIDATSDLVFLKDESFRYLMSNEADNSFLGQSEENVIGRTDFDLMPSEAAERCRASDREALEKGKRVTSEESVGRRTYQTIKFPVPLPSGRVGLGCYIRDITDRKRAEEAREQTEAQLRQSQKMEAIGTLAGGVAHDFNNLLTGILGNIALMRASLPAADPVLDNLNATETAARQAADLTQGLLTFGRSAMVLPVPMRIPDTLDATLAILKQSLPATIEIIRDDGQATWNVLLDQSQMTQILLNLAVNARDAMDGKGTLTVCARNEAVGEEYVQCHSFARTGDFVHLSIADTGSGIPAEILEHLFEPFHTTKPVGFGTGLGLSIVYGAVKQAGGWITAASTQGAGQDASCIERACSGTTFDVYLPRCLEEPMQSVIPRSVSLNVDGGTVLVVEDEPVVRTVAQALLNRSGYTVLTAPDGASALDILREHPASIGLVLLDMTMPGMTTREIVRDVRTLDPTVPILLNSGYTSNEIVKQMLLEGSVQGFLGKPYDPYQLVEIVQKLIARG